MLTSNTMINLFRSTTKSTSYSIICMLLMIPSCVFSAEELYKRCNERFSCGDQSNLYYPFWIPGREDCGHPDFKLNCSGGFAELNISSVKFRILETDNTSRIIRLARTDYIGDLCPQDPLNTPFDQNVLSFSPDTEILTIYFECDQHFSPRVSTYVGDFYCSPDVDDYESRNYYVTRNLSSPLLQGISVLLHNLRVTCRGNVSVPSSGATLKTLQNNLTQDNLKKALEEGFKLEISSDCSTCIGSKGACGYKETSGGFTCFHMEDLNGVSTIAIAGIGTASALVLVILIAVGVFFLIRRRRKGSDYMRQQHLKALIPLKHYSHAQLKKITKSFAEVVGKGGFGTVYRGTLCDGRDVAVKILKDSKGSGEDFINEVASMSKTSHVNIVSLLGFCSEGSKRAIIYEFVQNGSLDKFISSKNTDWKVMYEIGLGIARGLEYLHHGCKTRIVHFDIKPQNVLLDENLCPKVSDFGLAKLCEKKESTLSLLSTRGTIGYIAPEVFSRMYGRVSHKSDVYSYGMLILEMTGAREKTSKENSVSNTSSIYFPEWIYKDLEKGVYRHSITCEEEEEIAKKMTLVGLWCIQSSPSDRPPMNRVVEMMEGNLDALQVPPRPVLQFPTAPPREFSSLSEDLSV